MPKAFGRPARTLVFTRPLWWLPCKKAGPWPARRGSPRHWRFHPSWASA